ncbi:6-bladed beta-propeller [Candidatus Palauibacter sp.]|uniref:6-bladed beta-propeller n=1 Tax=Candidatus Palauibacter sp. TaxID=3101350 RepID=UPI003AF24243
MPLTFVLQLVPGADGSVFLLDAQTDGVLAFGPDGVFRRQIGRRGEGPGELLSPWRLGLLGRDTLWVTDARRSSVHLYDVSTGTSLEDFGSAGWEAAGGGGRLRPFAVLADHRVVATRRTESDATAEVLAFDLAGQRTGPAGVSLSTLDLRDRLLVVPVPAGGGGLQLRNPFSHSDMLAIDPSGRQVAVIRRPEPADPGAFFVVERHSVPEGGTGSIQVPYTPRPLSSRDVRAWAEALGPLGRMVELGVFPSRAAGVEAVLDTLDAPDYYPPIENRGRGIVDESVLVDSGGVVWLQASDPAEGANDWIVVSREGDQVSHVAVPDGIRLLAVHGDRVWGEVRDGFGVPSVHTYRIQPSRR